jgi:hypothetical protein
MISQSGLVSSLKGSVKGVPVLLVAFVVTVSLFLLKAYLVQWSWNSVVPRLSDDNKWNNLEYVDALFLTLLVGVLLSCGCCH